MRYSDFEKWKKARDYIFENRDLLRKDYGKKYLAARYNNKIIEVVDSHKDYNLLGKRLKKKFIEDSVYIFSIDDVIFQKSLADKIKK